MNDGDWRRMLFDGDGASAGPAPHGARSAAHADAMDANGTGEAFEHESFDGSSERRPSRLRDHGRGIRLNLVPMIDVVFQLLLFFVVMAKTLENERFFRLEVPPMKAEATSSARASPLPGASRARLVDSALRVRVRSVDGGAEITLEPALAQLRTIEELHDFLSQSMRRQGRGLFLEDQSILIDPDAECRWDDSIAAFNAAVRAGYRHVGFAGAGEGLPGADRAKDASGAGSASGTGGAS